MSNQLNWKRIIFSSSILLIIVLLLEIFVQPANYINLNLLRKFFEKVTASQYIAPKQLFINVWRITKNTYIDKDMNNQNWTYWKIRYVKKIKTIDDVNVAVNSMLASLNDSYSSFLMSNSYSKRRMKIDSKITGVGVFVEEVGSEIVINQVVYNSSADMENIQVGDVIVSIDGKKVNTEKLDEVIEALVIGEKDSVSVTIKRNNVLMTKKLTSKDIPIQTMKYEITDDNIGIITLSNIMGQKAVLDFSRILYLTNKTNGIIIDLRNNYGGLVMNAVQMAGFMMNEKEIVQIKSRANRQLRIFSEKDSIFQEKPIVVLVNAKTASAAEILAGTLQVNLGAVLIGERTYGKNVIQQVIPMHNRTGLVITTDKYILPNGEDIYKVGIKPDIFVVNEGKKDRQLEEAKKLINEVVKNKK
ncbi:MAG: PDZ domain-containing protein [Candidatus Gastranaerophilales bacterium]|nr:PDZ domain-containing protein [Candidatus Gastranaerophilales bacterium]